MKRVIWVLENVTGDLNFYTSVKVSMLLSSVVNWKRHNASHNVLYVDKLTHEFFSNVGIFELNLWDEVDHELLEEPCNINKIAFWSSSKLRVLSAQLEPVTLVDYDFITFTNLIEIGKEANFVYSHDENGIYAYPSATDQYIKNLKTIPDFLKWSKSDDAINVSYLSFNDLDFQKRYTKLSLDCMEELTTLNAPRGSYVCFAEQKILKQLALHLNIEHVPLIQNRLNAMRNEWEEGALNQNGQWNYVEAYSKFIHYGQDKLSFTKNGDEFRFLINSIKSEIASPHLDKIINL